MITKTFDVIELNTNNLQNVVVSAQGNYAAICYDPIIFLTLAM